MKYIKTFESIRKPKLNDYVSCEDMDKYIVSDWNEYVRTHIGKIIQIKPENEKSSTIYVVKYKDKKKVELMMNANKYNI